MGSEIGIKFHIAGNAAPLTMSLDPLITGNMLKQRVQYNVKKLPEDQTLFYQKPGVSKKGVD